MATITAVKKGKTYRGTAKADVITIASDAGSNITVKALGGSDTITVRGGKNSIIDAGKGNDAITLSGGRKNRIYGGPGPDVIKVSAGSNNYIYGSAGADTIVIGKKAGTGNRIYGNDGNDIITVAKTSGSNNKIWGGNGADTIVINGSTLVANGGTGKDVITVKGGTEHELTGGNGKDTFLFKQFTGNVTVMDYRYGEDTIRLEKWAVSRGEIFGSDTVLYLSNGRTITLKNAGQKPVTYINPAGKKVTVTPILTQQNVIRSFMKALDESTTILKSPEKALNAAVKYASNGKYKTWKGLLGCFISDIRQHGNKEEISFDQTINEDGSTVITPVPETHAFLTDFCGIDLINEDTGSISGSDAGGRLVKTPHGIIPESGTMADAQVPTAKTSTIDGLTFHWPEAKNDIQKSIIGAINKWWAKEGLSLINDCFGLNFREKGVTVSDIAVRFVKEESNTLAEVLYTYDPLTGKTEKLRLNIYMNNFNEFDMTDVSGYAGETSGYTDRILAHELTHAVMAANITGFDKLPECIKEGAAELIHGIDDFRTLDIISLAQVSNVDSLQEALYNMDPLKKYDINYAGGYMLQRYFSKQVSDSFLL